MGPGEKWIPRVSGSGRAGLLLTVTDTLIFVTLIDIWRGATPPTAGTSAQLPRLPFLGAKGCWIPKPKSASVLVHKVHSLYSPTPSWYKSRDQEMGMESNKKESKEVGQPLII